MRAVEALNEAESLAVHGRVAQAVGIVIEGYGPVTSIGEICEIIELKAGEIFDFTVKPGAPRGQAEEIRSVDVNYRDLVNDIHVGDTVLVDSGLIRLEVLEKHAAHIRCRVLIPGELKSRRHINLPGVHVNLPSFTEKDKGDTKVGIEEGIDFIALSFVREAHHRGIKVFIDIVVYGINQDSTYSCHSSLPTA